MFYHNFIETAPGCQVVAAGYSEVGKGKKAATCLDLKQATVIIDQETGKLVADWHGYEFKARRLQ